MRVKEVTVSGLETRRAYLKSFCSFLNSLLNSLCKLASSPLSVLPLDCDHHERVQLTALHCDDLCAHQRPVEFTRSKKRPHKRTLQLCMKLIDFQGKGHAQTSMSMSCMEPYRILLELFFIMGVDWIAWVKTLFRAVQIFFSLQLYW